MKDAAQPAGFMPIKPRIPLGQRAERATEARGFEEALESSARRLFGKPVHGEVADRPQPGAGQKRNGDRPTIVSMILDHHSLAALGREGLLPQDTAIGAAPAQVEESGAAEQEATAEGPVASPDEADAIRAAEIEIHAVAWIEAKPDLRLPLRATAPAEQGNAKEAMPVDKGAKAPEVQPAVGGSSLAANGKAVADLMPPHMARAFLPPKSAEPARPATVQKAPATGEAAKTASTHAQTAGLQAAAERIADAAKSAPPHAGGVPPAGGDAAMPQPRAEAPAAAERAVPFLYTAPDEEAGGSRLAANIRVVEAQGLPAPPAQPAIAPSLLIAGAVGEAPDWMALARNPVLTEPVFSAANAPAPLRTLTVHLHPAELGAVTATLRYAGEQLAIELKAERPEAVERLAADSDAIIKAVRSLGIEIDRVTIQQGQWSGSNGRTDANAFGSSAQRDGGTAMPGGNSAQDGGGGSGHSRFGGQDHEQGLASQPATPGGDRAHRGLYI